MSQGLIFRQGDTPRFALPLLFSLPGYLFDCSVLFISDTMRNYFLQIRQETGLRMCEKVFDAAADKPSKVSNHLIC
jgi:hypothetical protein